MAAALPAVPYVLGALGIGTGIHAGLEMHRAQSTAAQQAKAQADAMADFEMEMPELSFEMPAPPPLPEPPKPSLPPPSTESAANRAELEAKRAASRRRTLSLFSSSTEKEGRASTILTGSQGVQTAAPVRKRQLGGYSMLGGGAI